MFYIDSDITFKILQLTGHNLHTILVIEIELGNAPYTIGNKQALALYTLIHQGHHLQCQRIC